MTDFTQDALLQNTFGYAFEGDGYGGYNDVMNDVTKRVASIKTNLFKPVVVSGYNAFIIYCEGVNGNNFVGTDDKQYILSSMHYEVKCAFEDKNLLEDFIDSTHDTVVRERSTNNESHEMRSNTYLYILEVANRASEAYDQFNWIYDSHLQPIIDAFADAQIEIKADSDLDTLNRRILAAVEPDAISKSISNCIDADLKRLELDIIKVAIEHGLQRFDGTTWNAYSPASNNTLEI